MFTFYKKSQMVTLAVILSFISVSLLGITSSASAGMYLPYGMTYGVGWFDANKTWANTEDDLMCWAAAASNILTWGSWTPGSLNNEDVIFQYFQDHWTDQGGLMEFGWEWWFNGVNRSQGWAGWSQVDVPGGGFYPGYNFSDYYHRTWQDDQAMSAIDQYLHAGYGTTIGIYGPGGHALTTWGYFYDDITGDYTDLIFTDSDDYMSPDGSVRTLWKTSLNSSGGQWYLGGSSWYIGEVMALEPIPEPSTLLLLGSGLLGLAVFGIRRKKKA